MMFLNEINVALYSLHMSTCNKTKISLYTATKMSIHLTVTYYQQCCVVLFNISNPIFFITTSRPTLGPTQPPIQGLPGVLSLVVNRPGP